ncbi:MAG: sigma-70 family RNA polymerase sigma factor [Bacillota bacterium]|nr:sigma-70 family RNA polymerase sigma factor [Bacillota bacterium]
MPATKQEIYRALTACIEENQQGLYRMAYSYVHSPETAMDLVQETAYRALKSHGEIADPSQARPWLYKVLIRLCVDELRRNKRLEVTDPAQLKEESEDPLAGRAELMDLREAMERLDPSTKAVIILRYFEDRQLSEIAELLEENLSTVKSRLYRGLSALHTEMEGGVFACEQ